MSNGFKTNSFQGFGVVSACCFLLFCFLSSSASALSPPVASFTAVPMTGFTPLMVQFEDISTGGTPIVWNWSFGDGTWFNTTNSSLKNAKYQYIVPGNYHAYLIASNADGTSTSSAKTITVNPSIDPTIDSDDDGINDILELYGYVYNYSSKHFDAAPANVSDPFHAVFAYTNPYQPSTDYDPYDDPHEVSHIDVDPNLLHNHGSDPLVPAYPKVAIMLTGYTIKPISQVEIRNAKTLEKDHEYSHQLTHSFAFTSTMKESEKFSVEFGALEPPKGTVEIGFSAEQAEEWATESSDTESRTEITSEEWESATSYDPNKVARIKFTAAIYNGGSAPANPSQPRFGLYLGNEDLIASCKIDFGGPTYLTPGANPRTTTLSADENGQEITLSLDELRSIQLGMPFVIKPDPASLSGDYYEYSKGHWTAQGPWDNYIETMKVGTTLMKIFSGNSSYEYRISSQVQNAPYFANMTLGQALLRLGATGQPNGTLLFTDEQGKQSTIDSDWKFYFSDETYYKNELNRTNDVLRVLLRAEDTVILLSPDANPPAPEIGWASFTKDGGNLTAGIIPGQFDLANVTARVKISGQFQNISLSQKSPGSYIYIATPPSGKAFDLQNGTIWATDIMGRSGASNDIGYEGEGFSYNGLRFIPNSKVVKLYYTTPQGSSDVMVKDLLDNPESVGAILFRVESGRRASDILWANITSGAGTVTTFLGTSGNENWNKDWDGYCPVHSHEIIAPVVLGDPNSIITLSYGHNTLAPNEKYYAAGLEGQQDYIVFTPIGYFAARQGSQAGNGFVYDPVKNWISGFPLSATRTTPYPSIQNISSILFSAESSQISSDISYVSVERGFTDMGISDMGKHGVGELYSPQHSHLMTAPLSSTSAQILFVSGSTGEWWASHKNSYSDNNGNPSYNLRTIGYYSSDKGFAYFPYLATISQNIAFIPFTSFSFTIPNHGVNNTPQYWVVNIITNYHDKVVYNWDDETLLSSDRLVLQTTDQGNEVFSGGCSWNIEKKIKPTENVLTRVPVHSHVAIIPATPGNEFTISLNLVYGQWNCYTSKKEMPATFQVLGYYADPNQKVPLEDPPMRIQIIPGCSFQPRNFLGIGRFEDLNGDFHFTEEDLSILKEHQVWIKNNEPYLIFFDYNRDGIFDDKDILALENLLNQYQPPQPVQADFSASPLTGTAPLRVFFTDTSTGQWDYWNYNFGDGFTSMEKNPVHEYRKPGTYTVTLKVQGIKEGKLVQNTTVKQDLITVTGPPQSSLAANFTASPLSGNAPLKVTFTDKSTGDPDFWIYQFGDGTASSSRNPVHTFLSPGDYDVTLTVIKIEKGKLARNTTVRKALIVVGSP